MWTVILNDLRVLVQKIESQIQSAWHFLTAYIHEAIKEEEAALAPIIIAQASQLLQDVVKTQGLTVKERIAMAEVEIMADLVADGKVVVATLVASYVALTAHKLGLVDGNQGNLPAGIDSGVQA